MPPTFTESFVKMAIAGLDKDINAARAGATGPFPWLLLIQTLLPILLQFLPLLFPPTPTPTPVTGS